MPVNGASLRLLLLAAAMGSEAVIAQSEEALPDDALLEFLGEWETEQGEWIDPVELEDEAFAQLIETKLETDNED